MCAARRAAREVSKGAVLWKQRGSGRVAQHGYNSTRWRSERLDAAAARNTVSCAGRPARPAGGTNAAGLTTGSLLRPVGALLRLDDAVAAKNAAVDSAVADKDVVSCKQCGVLQHCGQERGVMEVTRLYLGNVFNSCPQPPAGSPFCCCCCCPYCSCLFRCHEEAAAPLCAVLGGQPEGRRRGSARLGSPFAVLGAAATRRRGERLDPAAARNAVSCDGRPTRPADGTSAAGLFPAAATGRGCGLTTRLRPERGATLRSLGSPLRGSR